MKKILFIFFPLATLFLVITSAPAVQYELTLTKDNKISRSSFDSIWECFETTCGWIAGGNREDWHDQGEIIVTTGWDETIIADCDFIIDQVKIWGDRTPFIPEEPDPVPEPAPMLLLGAGLIALAGFSKKFKK